MKKEMLSVLSILMLMIGLLLGVSYAVNEERDSSGLFWVILFIALAIGLYLWLRRSERQEGPAETALRKAQEAEDYAEDVFGRVKSAASSTAAPAAKQEAPKPAPEAKEEAPKPAPEAKQETPKPAPETKQEAPAEEEAPKPAPLAPAPPAAVVPVEEKKPKAEKPAVKAEDMPTEPLPKPEIAEVEAAAAAEAPTTEVKAASASAEPDDLTLIEGIGPYYRDILHAAGVTSFEALSKLDPKKIEQIAKDAGARRAASMATWPQQAALAAKGDWAGLDALQSSLTAGRKS